ncbi:MAG TPA: hypothetical protein DEF85_02500 [Clostridiaceae bacterium]|jgi:hypothetical protein|nr:hypothetical protein [Clostridiaceae bacterium]HBX47746.1 hypothetical protein [Clostridiaceae bacterium]
MCPYMIIWVPVNYFDMSYEYNEPCPYMYRSTDFEDENAKLEDDFLKDEYYEADIEYINSQL